MQESVRRNPKPGDSYEPHLVINEMALLPGGEWSPQQSGWLVAHVSYGVGYWLHPCMSRELPTGAVVLCSYQAQGYFRASQLGELRLHFFRVDPRKLTGLVSMADQRHMEDAAGDQKFSLRVLPPNEQFSEKFRQLSPEPTRNSFPARVQLLQLFLHVFGSNFLPPRADVTGGFDAGERLKQMLNQTPVNDLLELSFSELASQTGCSPRHVSRLFKELVGVSFREKQAELRLARACELLAATDSKVVDVAMESGYQSTSLFSAMFKQRFGTSPAKWRERARQCKPAKQIRRLRVVA